MARVAVAIAIGSTFLRQQLTELMEHRRHLSIFCLKIIKLLTVILI